VRAYRLLRLLVAAGILTGASFLCAQAQPSPGPVSSLAAQDEEYQRLYQQINSSVVRVTVTQSALAIVKNEGLSDKFDAWQKTNDRGGRGRGGPGGGGAMMGGDGRGSASTTTSSQPRPDGATTPGGFGRGNPGGGGGPGGPGFGGGGRGGGGGPGSISSQVRNFFRDQADLAQKAGNLDQAARYRGLALRVQVNPAGLQGEMLAAILDNEGHALLLGGVFKEAQLPPAPPMKVLAPDGTPGEATFVGANLYAGFTVIKLNNVKGLAPASWSAGKLKVGQTLLPVTSGQSFVATVHVRSRFGEAFSEDRLPADEQSNPRFERYGAFLFDIRGNLAAVVTTGGGWAGERFALSATRLQRDIAYILKENKDIEPRALGVTFTAKNRDVQVSAVTAGSLAAQAQLKVGDILLSIDGRPMFELVTADGNALPGLIQLQVDLVTRTGNVPLVIVRDGKQLTLQMPLQ
jgi:S1-C subfamily serine protease